jgi:putative ABC transport system permease protein
MIDYLELTLKNLSHQKLRTLLTLLGVVIGITAVVSMISIGEGMSVAIKKQFEQFGFNKIIVTPRAAYGIRGEGLTDEDSNAIEKIVGVEFVSPMLSVVTGSEFRGEEKAITVWALDPGKAERTFSDVSGYRILQGRWLRTGDKKNIVVGYRLHDDYYERPVNLGNTIKIQGEEFRVVGIFRETGDPDHDTKIFADLDYIRKLLGRDGALSAILVRVKPGYDVDEVRDRIENLLEKRHKNEEFAVMTSKQLLETLEKAYGVVQIVFGGIAAISLIVGGIGISNTMIMNVMERVHEIGIMKATGADNYHVLKIFIFESGILGVIGGAMGVIFGSIISLAINIAAESTLGPGILVTAVTPRMVVLALIFSFIVGIVSGIYPAYRAVKLDPVQSLRA